MSSRAPGSILAALLACGDFERGPRLARDRITEDPGSGAFAEAVHPLLVARCRACHAPGGSAQGTAFVLSGSAAADHAVALRFVDLGAPAASRLLVEASGVGHAGGAIIASGSREQRLLLDWIALGAEP